jgi:hypothetical protein
MDRHVKRSGHDLSQYAIPIIACRQSKASCAGKDFKIINPYQVTLPAL